MAAKSGGGGSRPVGAALHADICAGYGGIDADAPTNRVGDGPGGRDEAVVGLGAPLGVS